MWLHLICVCELFQEAWKQVAVARVLSVVASHCVDVFIASQRIVATVWTETLNCTELFQFCMLEELGVESVNFRNIEGSIILMELEQVCSHLLFTAERTFPALVGTLEVAHLRIPYCEHLNHAYVLLLVTCRTLLFVQRSDKYLAAATFVDRAITHSEIDLVTHL